jgi:hypothetical protein
MTVVAKENQLNKEKTSRHCSFSYAIIMVVNLKELKNLSKILIFFRNKMHINEREYFFITTFYYLETSRIY